MSASSSAMPVMKILDVLYEDGALTLPLIQRRMEPMHAKDVLKALQMFGDLKNVRCWRDEQALLWDLSDEMRESMARRRGDDLPEAEADPEPETAAPEPEREPARKSDDGNGSKRRTPKRVLVCPYVPAKPEVVVGKTGDQVWIAARSPEKEEPDDEILIEQGDVPRLIEALRAVGEC